MGQVFVRCPGGAFQRLGTRGNPEATRQDSTPGRCKPGLENSRGKSQKGTRERQRHLPLGFLSG
jgi:hypothetical protein